MTLPEAEQQKRIGAFFDLLRALRGPIRLRLARKLLEVPVGGRQEGMPIMQLHVSSSMPLGPVLDALHYEYASDIGGRGGLRPLGEGWRHVVVDPGDGSEALARCYCLTGLPSELPWAWLATSVFPACYEASAWISPVPNAEALRQVGRRRELLSEAARHSRRHAGEYAALERAEESLRRTNSGLFRCTVVCVVLGRDAAGLREAASAFRTAAGMGGCRFSTQVARQASMLELGWGRELTFDLGSMSCLYPMVSGDMLEVPNGLVLGINTDSGAPVIFDFEKRSNYNVAVIGTSGSGKSFAAKMILHRLLQKHPGSACFVIDPMGEYHGIAGMLGLERTELGGGGLGLDPFGLLPPADAADMLGEVTRAPEEVIKQFRRHSGRVRDIGGLYGALAGDPGSQRWLDDLVEGPLAGMMRGAPQVSDRLVISMRGADGKPHEAMVLVLALSRAWRRIEELPQNVQKIILLDEAWLVFRMPGAAKYVEQVVRMGRKRNVRFIFVSQNVDDIAGARGAQPRIVDNIETKVLLNMEDEAAAGAARVLGLSPQEHSRLRSSGPGHAVLITKGHRLHLRFEPTAEEARAFETSPAAAQ